MPDTIRPGAAVCGKEVSLVVRSLRGQGLESGQVVNEQVLNEEWRGAGHSLGGALATLAAYDIAIALPSAHVAVYTFGSPRRGTALA